LAGIYTFRFLDADGKILSLIFVELPDLQAAELRAKDLMPENAVSVEIWRDEDLISRKSRSDDADDSVAPSS